jgi:hypothetical protein
MSARQLKQATSSVITGGASSRSAGGKGKHSKPQHETGKTANGRVDGLIERSNPQYP